MKRINLIAMVAIILMVTILVPLSSFAEERYYQQQAKISEDLKQVLSEVKSDEKVEVYVFMSDIDADESMLSFKSMDSKAYKAYKDAKEADDWRVATIDADLDSKDSETQNKVFGKEDAEKAELIQLGIELKRKALSAKYAEHNKRVLKSCTKNADVIFESSYAPMVILRLTKTEIDDLIASNDVESVDLFVNAEAVPEWTNSNIVSRTKKNRDQYGLTGAGVKIGQIEPGVPTIDGIDLKSTNVSIVERNPESTQQLDTHATLVAKIMVGNSYGVVPNAKLYCYGIQYVLDYYNGVERLLNLGINVINLSMGFSDEDGNYSGKYDIISKWTDHVANQHDVHIVKSAGNRRIDEDGEINLKITSPGMGYNVITVGAYSYSGTVSDGDANHGDDVMSVVIQGSNYRSCYMEAVGSAPRAEKPNLVAPGINLGPENKTGSSYSAPQVTGTIAQLCEFKPELKVKQAAMGAILHASSARKVQGVTGDGLKGDKFISSVRIEGNSQVSDREGAGKLDAYWARLIASRGTYWTVATKSFPYTKTITINTSSNSLTRVAIFWLKKNKITETDHQGGTVVSPNIPNLNLAVYDANGNVVSSSTMTYANFEIVQFVPTGTGTYTIKITCVGTQPTANQVIGIAVW